MCCIIRNFEKKIFLKVINTVLSCYLAWIIHYRTIFIECQNNPELLWFDDLSIKGKVTERWLVEREGIFS